MSLHHGHESHDHRAAKRDLGSLLSALGCQVYFEANQSDLVAVRCHPGRLGRLLCGEVQTRLQHTVPNLRRDFARGASVVLIVVDGAALRAAVRRQVRRAFPRQVWSRIAVLTLPSLQRALARLRSGTATGHRSSTQAGALPFPGSSETLNPQTHL